MTDLLKHVGLAEETLRIGRCNRPVFQKESFWLSKGALLALKRSPFAVQNESFYRAKRVLL